MKQVFRITKVISTTDYIGVDSVGVSHQVTTDKHLRVGQSILLKNGIVIGVVQTITPDVYEV